MSTARRVTTQAIRLGSVFCLARLLTPSDTGLVAMAAFVTGIFALLADLQLTAATIRFHNLDHTQCSNLFWTRLAVTLVFAAAVSCAAPLMQSFYGDQRVGPLVAVLSLGLPLGALSAQHSALLRRALRIGDLARIEIWSAVMTAAVSVSSAMAGMGYWALVIGSLAGGATSVVLAWSFCDWRPSLPARMAGSKPLFAYGLHLSSFAVLAYLASNLSNLLIGRTAGAAAAGQYTRANNMHMLMLTSIWEPLDVVAGPALAKLAHEPARMVRYYYQVSALAVMIAMPVAFVGIALPHEFVRVLLGLQWERSAGILALLSLGIVPSVISHTTGWVYFSVGDSARVMRWGAIGWPAMILAVAIGSLFGPEAIAAAYSIALWLIMLPCLKMAFGETPIRMAGLFKALAKPIMAGITTAIVTYPCLLWMGPQSSMVRLATGGTLYATLYVTLLLTLFGQRRLLADILSQLRKVPVQPPPPDEGMI